LHSGKIRPAERMAYRRRDAEFSPVAMISENVKFNIGPE
jgi:hypothetical protein